MAVAGKVRKPGEVTAETREKLSAAIKKLWQDPEYRAMHVASFSGREMTAKTREKLSEAGKRNWQDPEYRTRQMAAIMRGVEIKRENRGKMSEPGSEVEPRFTPHREYLKSGAWKCPQSPTGAHHWIINGEMMKCKYCPEERRVKQLSYIGVVT